MPSGGARMNSGPPPDPDALRRDRAKDKDGWTLLPAEGRSGVVPPWPLRTSSEVTANILNQDDLDDEPDIPLTSDARRQQARESVVWAALWSTPQAVVWERQGATHDVALYVRWLVMAEEGDMKAASEARQWSDRLGLNPSAMLRNRWKISSDELAERRGTVAKTSTARDRLKVLESAV